MRLYASQKAAALEKLHCGGGTSILFVGMKFNVPLFMIGWLQASCKLHEACNHPIRKSGTLNFIPFRNIVVGPQTCCFWSLPTFWEVRDHFSHACARNTSKNERFWRCFEQRFSRRVIDRVSSSYCSRRVLSWNY